jgi:RNA polymerase sigma-70 factor (ECF subfamily)
LPTRFPHTSKRTPAAPHRQRRPEASGRQADRGSKDLSSPSRCQRGGEAPWESDAELVREILSGSRDHFETLYRVYFPRVYRFALKRLGDPGEAEDVTQEVFITVFRSLDTYAGNSSLLVWIFGITRNKVNRRFRGARPRFEVIGNEAEHEIAAKEASPDRVTDARRMLEQCETAIQTELTPLQRRIFHLKHLRRQSIRSIAGALGKSEDAVKANLYRMRRALTRAAPGLEQLLGA